MTTYHRTTAGQAALWMADQMAGSTGAYNTTSVLVLPGDVSRDRVEDAVTTLFAQTPILDLRFGLDETGAVVQWSGDGGPRVEWLERGVVMTGAGQLDAALGEAVFRPFSSEGGPLTRVTAAPKTDGGTVLAVTVHHCLSDGVAQEAVAGRLVRALSGSLCAQPLSTYFELVEAVRRAEAESWREDGPYWRSRLALSQGHTWRPGLLPVGSPGYRRVALEGTGSKSAASASPGVTEPTRLVAALHLALRDLAETSVVAMAASVRPGGARNLQVPGYFVNLVPLQDVAGVEGVDRLLGSAAEPWRNDLARRRVPLGRLVAEVGVPVPDRVHMTYRTAAAELRHQSGVDVDLFTPRSRPVTDVSVRFVRVGSKLTCEVTWDATAPAGVENLPERLSSIFTEAS